MKKKIKQPNWDLIRNKMVKYVTDVLQKKWQTPIILDVYEFRKIPQMGEGCEGLVMFFIQDGELYIESVLLKKGAKEKMIYVLSHELGHILDFVKFSSKELSLLKEVKYDTCNKKDRRILYEKEKRACSEGLRLLQQMGLPTSYLERYLVWRQNLLGCIISFYGTKQKNKRKNDKK